jgi:endonuclease VIII-like 1
MPELAEVRLTSDYVGRVSEKIIFHSIWKNPVHKGKEIKVRTPFCLSSESRGKEMRLSISPAPNFFSDSREEKKVLYLMMTMGMSGHFRWIDNTEELPKHTHLSFNANSGKLCFVDVRRFGRWSFGSWNPQRGPDPTQEFTLFQNHLYENSSSRAFQRPIHEVLMNQSFFNGIGNYLRAEILYRTDCNPFSSAVSVLQAHPGIISLCRDLPLQAYALGGGRLKDWENPEGAPVPESWHSFMLCYGNPEMARIKDRNGRTFWYDPKWNPLT